MKHSKTFVTVLAMLVLGTVAAWAADATGTWKSTMETPRGTMERTFVLKQDGDKLTGKIVTQQGEREIKDGKVKGDSIEFSIEQPGRDGGPARTTTYKGKLDGDTIKGSVGMGERNMDWTATRQK